jgi:ethanolamine utilization protein EutA
MGASHSVTDHRYGVHDEAHEHGGDSDHDHDHDDAAGAGPGGAEHALWMQDNVILHSVGIDIGSSSTQVVFSKIHLQRISDQLSTRYVVVQREPLAQPPLALTPYQSETLIDAQALGAMIEAAYQEAGLHPDQIDAGAVILTGEALRRENGQAIAAMLAEQGGEFVCATAGHHMESRLAVYGSGAARRSFDQQCRILNIDIGGGTTKLGLVDCGELRATAAVHTGGRLLVTNAQNAITRLDPQGRAHARRAGFDWQLGSVVTREQLRHVAGGMADALIRILTGHATAEDRAELMLTDPMAELAPPANADGSNGTPNSVPNGTSGIAASSPNTTVSSVSPVSPITGVMFSGGVGEYVYRREPRDFCDLGKLFGEALRTRLDAGALPWPLLPAGECIRATVLGASEYSVQLSGNTTFISEARALLPRKNLQVVPLPLVFGEEPVDATRVATALAQAFTQHDLVEGEQDVAVALRWSGPPAYKRLSALKDGLLLGLSRSVAQGRNLYIVTDGDIALTLGYLIKEDPRVAAVLDADASTVSTAHVQATAAATGPNLAAAKAPRSEVLSIDGITLWGFDFIDLGRIRLPSNTVPVSIKSLVFSEDPRSHGKSSPHTAAPHTAAPHAATHKDTA